MEWAEQIGLGELQLTPDQFWSLTPREFRIKHEAFSRAEDRKRSLMYSLAVLTASGMKKEHRAQLERAANALKRYPVKRWLKSQ